MKEQKVYIAKIKTLLPELFDADVVANLVYPVEQTSELVNRLVKKAIKSIGIKQRSFVRDLDKYPEKFLAKNEYSPLQWGIKLVNELTTVIPKNEIGFLSVSYNVTSHIDILPNLACQIASETKLGLEKPPQELSYLGCAASLFSLESVIEYCKQSQKAAIVFNFDQCSWLCNPVMDSKDPNFSASLKANLLFSDGAAGLLVIPELMRNRFNEKLIKIIDVKTGFRIGSEIKMENGKFLVGGNLRSEMPDLVANLVLKPMFENNNIKPTDIIEWSIHQGGKPILRTFTEPELLGLTQDNIERSLALFEQYGNFSSPSCMFVLDSFFKEDNNDKNSDTLGVVIGFGAGYYIGAMLYNWE